MTDRDRGTDEIWYLCPWQAWLQQLALNVHGKRSDLDPDLTWPDRDEKSHVSPGRQRVHVPRFLLS